jgi:hypothetical protein
MKCAIARPPKTRVAGALLAAAVLATGSAGAQELRPLPPPALPSEVAPGLPSRGAVPSPSPGAAEVRFEPGEPDVTLLRLSAAVPVERVTSYNSESWYSLYGPLCQGPCTTHLPPGAYRLALAKGGRIVTVRGPVVIEGPATLHGDYIDRSVLRATGLVVGVAGAVGGFVMIVASAQSRAVCDFNGICVSTGTANGPLLAGGVAVLVVSAVVGSILTFQNDGARITVEPLPAVRALGGAPREGTVANLQASQPQGAAVALHF